MDSAPQKNNRELEALINLLDEPDDKAFETIKDRIISFGLDAIGNLELARDRLLDGIVQDRINEILKSLQSDVLKSEFTEWVSLGSSDLLKGYLLVTKTEYPDLDQEQITQQIEQIKLDAWLELNDNLTALENVRVLNHIFYEHYHFEPNRINIHALENCYINTFLQTKKGSPLSLGMLYMIIAQKLNVPVYGVNLPQHFILAYTTEMVRPYPTEHDVLFYINPFNNGTIFTRKEIELFVHQLKLKPNESFFAPCTNIDIIRRLIMNLKFTYSRSGKLDKVSELDQLLTILE